MSADEPDGPRAHEADVAGRADDAPPSDPAAVLAMIAAQRASTRKGVEPNGPLLFGAWGVAWLIGYLVLYVTYDETLGRSTAWGFVVFGLFLLGALAFTAVHVARRASGVRGASAAAGAMYGWSWVIAFMMACLLFAGLSRAGASPEVMAITANGVSALIVAVMYMAGGALWRVWRMFALGAWIAVVAGAAALIPQPGTYLVMALAGGGGFLVAAFGDLHQTRRRTKRSVP
ncbi:hypothetical protein EXU48_01660 [Occultella glacieicola]|uniref:Transporter n=1 Tax=Occultella glacieicola TaxID=2518684 RepID=A0ABY2E8W6_9MICO|nr:hypothetical protein [Occultella glacieicola]TDE98927.1 hypothetical protein EXU48_01660 [Occultella glacieicola]